MVSIIVQTRYLYIQLLPGMQLIFFTLGCFSNSASFWTCDENSVNSILIFYLLICNSCLELLQGLLCFSCCPVNKMAESAQEARRGHSKDNHPLLIFFHITLWRSEQCHLFVTQLPTGMKPQHLRRKRKYSYKFIKLCWELIWNLGYFLIKLWI